MFLLQLFFNKYKAVIKTNTIIKSFVDFALENACIDFYAVSFPKPYLQMLYIQIEVKTQPSPLGL